MTRLIIARHGNTFEPGETLRRVGARTDLPLVEKGREQARALGRYLSRHRLIPDVVYASGLQRTQETAQIAIRESGVTNPVYVLDIFNEIDYGPDENKTEEEVIARIGAQALQDWDERAAVPPGWLAAPETIMENWRGFANHIRQHDDNETILVVTSNGTARFLPCILPPAAQEEFYAAHTIKIATGALCRLDHDGENWVVREWNVKP
jgi:probable phosphoglycerate mutase